MNTLDGLLTLSTALLAVGIYILTFIIRRLVEALAPTVTNQTPPSKAQMVWEKVGLQSLPVVVGALFCLIVRPQIPDSGIGFPYPAVVVGVSSRVLYGMGIGWFSAWAYAAVKFILKKQWNVPFPDDTVPPPPADAAKAPILVPPNDPPPAPPSAS